MADLLGVITGVIEIAVGGVTHGVSVKRPRGLADGSEPSVPLPVIVAPEVGCYERAGDLVY